MSLIHTGVVNTGTYMSLIHTGLVNTGIYVSYTYWCGKHRYICLLYILVW